MVMDKYCSGMDVYELVEEATGKDQKEFKERLLHFVGEVYDIIIRFHVAGIYLGNLTLSSFRE